MLAGMGEESSPWVRGKDLPLAVDLGVQLKGSKLFGRCHYNSPAFLQFNFQCIVEQNFEFFPLQISF